MSHIAICVPVGTGHVNPTLGVAAELVARGHRVSYAATTAHAGRVADAGARLVPYRTLMNDAGPPPQFTGQDFAHAMTVALDETEFVLPQVLSGFHGDDPDLVLHDATMAWWGRLAAASWSVPVVAGWPNLVGNRHWSMNRYVKVNPLRPKMLRALWRAQRLARRHGLNVANLLQSAGADAQLVFLPREFQYAGDTFGPPYAFVGPCLTDRPSDGDWEPPTERATVLVSLGTAYHDRPDIFRACLAAFADAPWHVVVAIGSAVDAGDLGAVAPHIEVRAAVPQLKVLPHAAAFVSHAGMGSTMESLAFGVPVVALPQMTEQQANADRIAELGLGVTLPATEVNPEALRAAVDHVITSAQVAENVRLMRERIRAAGGAHAAADVVERLLATRSDVPRTR
ncbi:glycosyltransferase [Mycobacterium sp. ITM-2016-00317]|uniref:macrolide family glycosyltransferase n=1 Tax=Mycobacterium sp. ITM-2016-00317 TaxID=2099694 RepID=UPI00287FE348|nr:macrolide family glycosyltransferase [Mycobacterium sp. ITM-2016-00317]WNG87595.1 glycosyltransferase [Mycobacterium sp. ITM-2016-00317]